MESYKRVALSLMLLLSTPLTTFCMDDFEAETIKRKDANAATSEAFDDLAITPKGASIADCATESTITPMSSNLNVSPLHDDDLEDASLHYYSARSSIQCDSLKDFDTKSCDDLSQDAAYQALLKHIHDASVETNTPPSSPRISTPQVFMGVGIAGSLISAAGSAAPAIRGIRIDDGTRVGGAAATEAIFWLFKKCGAEIGLAITLGWLVAETRKTIYMEEDNKTLTRQVATLHETIQRLALTNRKHELVEQGLIATEHKVLKGVHDYLCAEATLIAKGSQPNQAVATLQAILNKNKTITKKVVLAMADLEKVHANAESLLKDKQHYTILNPLGWFKALKDMCQSHSNAAADDAPADTASAK